MIVVGGQRFRRDGFTGGNAGPYAHEGGGGTEDEFPALCFNLEQGLQQQKRAVDSGHWPLFRYNPQQAAVGKNPLHLDSKAPSIPYRDFIETEIRFNMLWRTHPEEAEKLLAQSQQEVSGSVHKLSADATLAAEVRESKISA